MGIPTVSQPLKCLCCGPHLHAHTRGSLCKCITIFSHYHPIPSRTEIPTRFDTSQDRTIREDNYHTGLAVFLHQSEDFSVGRFCRPFSTLCLALIRPWCIFPGGRAPKTRLSAAYVIHITALTGGVRIMGHPFSPSLQSGRHESPDLHMQGVSLIAGRPGLKPSCDFPSWLASPGNDALPSQILDVSLMHPEMRLYS